MRASRLAQQFAVAAGIAFVIFLIFKHADFGYDFHWAVLYEVNPTYKEVFGVWLLKGLATIFTGLFSMK